LFPVAAGAAPSRAAIGEADEDILAVEALESWAVCAGIRPEAFASIGLNIAIATAAPILVSGFLVPFFLLHRQWTEGHDAGFELDDEEDAEVG